MKGPLLQCSYMTGDSFAIAAWLALQPDERVVFLQDDSLPDSKTGFILGLYKNCGVDKQVSVIDLQKMWTGKLQTSPCKEIFRLWSGGTLPNSGFKIDTFKSEPPSVEKDKVIKQALTAIHGAFKAWPNKVTSVTGWLSSHVGENLDKRLTDLLTKWGIATLIDPQMKAFDEFLSARAMSNVKAKSLVLWSRQSGKRQGAHMELDSSYLGMGQLIDEFIAKTGNQYSVILVGDEKTSNKGTGLKLAKLAKDKGVLYLGEFWKDGEWTKRFDDNRLNQMAFWVYLNGKKSKLLHLGMRSGALELMSLLKMPALYLEPATSGSGKRMTAFAEQGIAYERLQIVHSPGLTGQWGQDYERGLYDKDGKSQIAVHGNWEKETASMSKQVKGWKMDRLTTSIDDATAEKDEAFRTRAPGRWKLKAEVDELHTQRKQVGQTPVGNFRQAAIDVLKNYDPVADDYTRVRGFDPDDVTKIIAGVVSRI